MGVLLQDIGREDRKEHHAQRRKQHAEDLADGRDGENLRTDGRDVHPRPPERIAEAVELGIDEHLVVVEHQPGDIGKDDDGEDIGEKEPPHPVFGDQPPHDDHHGQEGPEQRDKPDEHAPVVGHADAAPHQDVQVGNGKQQERQVAPEKTARTFGSGPADEEIAQENEADDELDRKIGAGHVDMVAGNDLPREGHEEHQSGNEFDNTERITDSGTRRLGKRHRLRVFRSALKINATTRNHKFYGVFLPKDFARLKISITFALAFSNGGLAQLVRAHDS